MQISYLIFPVCAIFQEKDKCVIYLTSAAVIVAVVIAVIAVVLSENKHFKISHIKHERIEMTTNVSFYKQTE